MKDEIKTLSEYQALVKEYKESDSVSRRDSIIDAIYNKAKALLHKLIALYAKYGKDYVADNDFQEDRGYLLLSFDEDKVWLHYSDRAYGDECDIGIEVQMKYLDNDSIKALEKELREEHVLRVKTLIQQKSRAFEQLKKATEELETEIKELEAELEVEEKAR